MEAACRNKWNDFSCGYSTVCEYHKDICQKRCGGCRKGNIDTTTMFLGDEDGSFFLTRVFEEFQHGLSCCFKIYNFKNITMFLMFLLVAVVSGKTFETLGDCC